jgi:hypothetical protein
MKIRIVKGGFHAMEKRLFLIAAFALTAVLMVAGTAVAAPQHGLLVDKNGTPVMGYSNVYVYDGQANPVYSSNTQLWYTVFVIGKSSDGTVLCELGQPMGVDSSATYWQDNEDNSTAENPD